MEKDSVGKLTNPLQQSSLVESLSENKHLARLSSIIDGSVPVANIDEVQKKVSVSKVSRSVIASHIIRPASVYYLSNAPSCSATSTSKQGEGSMASRYMLGQSVTQHPISPMQGDRKETPPDIGKINTKPSRFFVISGNQEIKKTNAVDLNLLNLPSQSSVVPMWVPVETVTQPNRSTKGKRKLDNTPGSPPFKADQQGNKFPRHPNYVNTGGQPNIIYSENKTDSSSTPETTSLSNKNVCNTQNQDTRNADGTANSATLVGNSPSIDTTNQDLNPPEVIPPVKGHVPASAERMSLVQPDYSAELMKGPFWDSVVKSVRCGIVARDSRYSPNSRKCPPCDVVSDKPNSHTTDKPTSTAPPGCSEEWKNGPFNNYIVKSVNGESRSFRVNTWRSEKTDPSSNSTKLFVITDKQGKQRRVKTPSWMTSSTALSLIFDTNHVQSGGDTSKKPTGGLSGSMRLASETGNKIGTRLKTGALSPICWREMFIRPYTRDWTCSSKKRMKKDKRAKRKKVVKSKKRKHVHRLHSIKENNLDNSINCEATKQTCYSEGRGPSELEREYTDESPESPVIPIQECLPLPEVKISLRMKKDKRAKKEKVVKSKKRKHVHRFAIGERLHSIKENNLDNSINGEATKQTCYSEGRGPRELEREYTDESPVIPVQECHPLPEVKISLPTVQLKPLPLSVKNIGSFRLDLHEDDSADTSHRLAELLVNKWSSSTHCVASGLTDLADIKKESTSEGSLHSYSDGIDHCVKVEENLEINIELRGDTQSQGTEEDDLRCETSLESTEIPRDFSLMRGKDRIKILRERMKMREKEIEALTRNRPRIEQII